jgi:hypothetical protein
MDCTEIACALPSALVSSKSIQVAPRRRRLAISIAALYLLGIFTVPLAHANAADQARRITHFQWLQSRGVFQSMGVVSGTPQLVLGSKRGLVDNNAMAVFCQIIFDYFVENNPAVTTMVVIDGTTGTQFAIVDSSGFHVS